MLKTFSCQIVALLLLVFLVLLAGCGGGPETANNSTPVSPREVNEKNTPVVNEKAEELGMLIKLPFVPVEVAFMEQPAVAEPGRSPGPNDKKLRAVILYEKEDAESLAAEAAKLAEPTAVEIDADTWFPAELVSQSELNEGQKLKGKAYPADMLFQAPYLAGTLVRIDETNYFVVEMYTR